LDFVRCLAAGILYKLEESGMMAAVAEMPAAPAKDLKGGSRGDGKDRQLDAVLKLDDIDRCLEALGDLASDTTEATARDVGVILRYLVEERKALLDVQCDLDRKK